MEILRDSFWNGFSAIIAVLSLIVAVWVEKEKLSPLGHRVFIAVANLVVGVFVMSLGFIIQPVIWYTLQYGVSVVPKVISVLGNEPLKLLLDGLFPGAVTAVLAASGRMISQRMKRGAIAGVIALIIWDTFQIATRAPTESAIGGAFWFTILCDVIGGVLAGIIIAYLIEWMSVLFGESK